MSSYIPSSRRLGSTMMKRTSSGVARIRMLVIIALTLTDLPAPVEPAISRCGIVARSLRNGSPWMVLPIASVSFDVDRLVGVRLEQLAQRDLLAIRVGNLDADRGLARDAIDDHRLGLHRQAEIVGQPGDLAVLHAGVRLELVGRHDRAGMNLDDGAFDGELAALFLEQPRAVHQLALVDLLLAASARRAARGRQRERALLPFDRRLVGLRQRQRRLLHRHRRAGRA